MKPVIQKIGVLTAMLMAFISASAYDFEVDGIYYNIIDESAKEVAVTYRTTSYNSYSGDITIPASVTKNNVKYSVTSIGSHAFDHCSSLTSITIPNSVTSIKLEAFYYCSGLTSITIPNSVTSIGKYAFAGCEHLYSITLGSSLTEIGLSAFACPIWKAFWLADTPPSGVSNVHASINYVANDQYNLSNQKIYPFLSSRFEIDNVIYVPTSDRTCDVIDYNYNSSSENIEINVPSSATKDTIKYEVTSIGPYAFYSFPQLTSITIPNGVTSIGEGAFGECTSLTSITIPNSVTSIGDIVFYHCSNLTSITIPDNVTSIGYSVFSNCSSLTSITIPNSVTSIGEGAFYKCSSLTSITLPNSVTSIGYEAFRNSSLTSIVIPENVTYVGDYALAFITKVFWLPNTPPKNASRASEGVKINYVANNQYNFSNQKVYPFLSSRFEVDNVVYVPVSPSDRTCDVVDCNYNQTISDIEVGSIVVNKGVQLKVFDINPYSFYNNQSAKNIKINNNGSVGDYAFYNCSLSEKLEIGKYVTTIGSYAFQNNKKLKQLILPDNISGLGQYAFSGCNELEKVYIGKGIPVLPKYVFSGCSALSEISIPSNVASIEDYAFSGCSSLSDVTIEQSEEETMADNVLKLGSNGSSPIFADCPLDEIYIGRKLNYSTASAKGYSPFYRNTSLRAVTITDAETEIYDNEFYGCSNLQSFSCGDGVTKIGKWAFSGCSAMKSYSSGTHVAEIGAEAFSDCTGLTSFTTLAAVPPTCGNQALDDINKWECTLKVPAESVDDYQAAPQWKEFFFIEGTTGDDETTAIEDIVLDQDYKISISADGITIDGVADMPVSVYTIDGRLLRNMPEYRGEEISLAKGIYIVRIGLRSKKIMI